MNIPALIFLCIIAISLLCSAYLHGQEKDGKWSFWWALGVLSSETLLLLWAIGWTLK